MDKRTDRRQKRIELATKLAARLNDRQTYKGKQTKRVRSLATEKPRMLGYGPDGEGGTKPWGYARTVVTRLRPYGRATLYWHAKRRAYIVKVDRTVKGGDPDKTYLLDKFEKVSGLVSLCACGTYFAKLDGRQRYCSPKCSGKYRSRRARQRAHSRTARGLAQIKRAERAFAERRRRLADGRQVAAYVAAQVDDAKDKAARREQQRLRHEAF